MCKLIFFVKKNYPFKYYHQIQKIKFKKDRCYHLFPAKYYYHQHHPLFLQSRINPDSPNNTVTIDVSDQELEVYFKNNQFIFNQHILEKGN